MPKKRNPQRDEAFEIYKEHDGKIDLVKIAEQLGISPGTVRGWKSKDKWQEQIKGTFQKKERNVPKNEMERSKKGGAPKGNQNAKGNVGGGAPVGNKNAAVTGEYESLFADYLSDEYKDIYLNMSDDPLVSAKENLRVLKAREHLMMSRLRDAEEQLSSIETIKLYELRKVPKSIVDVTNSREVVIKRDDMVETERREKISPTIVNVLRCEEALTRINTAIDKAAKTISDLVMAEHKTELIMAQTAALNAKNDNNGSEVGLNSAVSNLTTEELRDLKKGLMMHDSDGQQNQS